MAYSKIRETTIGGQAGTTWTIQMWRENYSGSSSSMDLQGEGFEITWTGEGQTRNNQFLTSECVLKFYVQNGGDESLQDLIFNSGEKEFFIRIYKNGTNISNLWWFGFIQPSFDRISNEPYPYIIDLIATDSIGVFSKRKNDLLTPSTWSAADKIINHIVDFGSTMGLNSVSGSDLAPVPANHRYIKTNIDWFRSGDTYQDADPFYSYYTSPAAYRKDVDKRPLEYKKYNVLKGALKTFNARCYLSDGAYWFTQSTNNLGSSGDIKIYNYLGVNNEVPNSGHIGNENTILHINQTTSTNKGVVLGSGGKTFDPVLKSVSCDFVNGVANFILPGNTSLITPISTGYLQGDADQVGSLFISLKVYHKEVFNENQINFPSGSPTYDLVNGGFRSTINFTIKVGTGSDTRYLAVSGTSMVWQTSVPTGNFKLEMTRGFGAFGGSGALLLNNTSAAYGWANTTSLSNSDFEIDEFPCKITKSGSIYTARTRVSFEGTIPPPPVSGEMTIQCVGANQYWVYASSATPPFKPDTGGVNFADQVPSTVTKETFVNPNLDSTLSANQDAISLGANEGVTFTTSQNSVDAFEDEDLGEINVGQTSETNPNFQSNINSVQHNTGTTNSPILVPSQNFRRADTGSYINILNLVTSDYLSLQSKPLEILQADIFSPSISPSKLIKYDIDNPESGTSFSYYQFLGGTFKAQSETMSGEWFRVSLTSGGINDNNPFVGPHKFGNIDIALDNSELTHNNFTTKNKTNSYGIVSTQLVENTAIDRIVLSANTKGKVYDNQKLLLTFPDGEHELIVTANGTFATNTTTIILDSFTPNITYPVGSILSPLIFDLTNVITGSGGGGTPGGSSTQVQYNQAGAFKGEAGFEYDEGNNRLTVPAVNTPILQSISGGTTLHQIYTVSQNMAIATNTGVDVFLNLGNASAGTTAFSIKDYSGNIVFGVTDTGVIKAIGNKIQDSAGTDRIDVATSGTTKIQGNTQLLGTSPATLLGPNADKLIVSSVDDLEFKIASGGASSKSFKFINNTTEVGSINSSGNLQIDGTFSANSIQIPNGSEYSGLMQFQTGSTCEFQDQNDETLIAFSDGGITSLIAAGNLDIGAYQFRALSFQSDVATGTAPFVVASTTQVANLQSSTTASIGNLTGEVTSTNRATVIADNVVDESNLKVSNAPVNGYVLTAQSGNTGGLTWAEQSGGGSSSSIITQIFTIAYHSVSTAGFYITMSGASLNESTVLTTSSYHLILPCPFDGTIKKITSHHQNLIYNGTSKFELYIDGDDDDLVGDQRGSDLTVTNGVNVAGSAGRVFSADCPSDWTFSKNETLAVKRTDSSGRGGTTVSFVIEFDTST